MTTIAWPKRAIALAWEQKSASPSLRLMELTTPRPWTSRIPTSMTDQSEESIMIGSRLTSGSLPRWRKKVVMAAPASKSEASMQTSIISAPACTCSLATRIASSHFS